MRFSDQRKLRQIFIAGHIIGIMVFFVPGYGCDNYGSYSQLESIRGNFYVGDTATALWEMAQITARVGILGFAIYAPKRWVFLAGATWASFILGTNLIKGNEADTIRDMLTYIQLLMRMTGFFIK